MYVWYTIKFENFSIRQRHQEDALLVAIMTRAWFESRDITDRCDRQLSTIQALCIQPTNTSSLLILYFTFSNFILCFYQTYWERVSRRGRLWKYFDLNAIWSSLWKCSKVLDCCNSKVTVRDSINNISACHDNIFKEIDVYDPTNAMIPAYRQQVIVNLVFSSLVDSFLKITFWYRLMKIISPFIAIQSHQFSVAKMIANHYDATFSRSAWKPGTGLLPKHN